MEVVEHGVRIGAAARPLAGEPVSGDAWSWWWDNERFLIAVVDGAGHGAPAADAARIALAAVEENRHLALDAVLTKCHAALHRSRGGVMTLALLDPVRQRLLMAGVGNVESCLWTGTREQRPVPQRGLLGATLPTVRPMEFQLDTGWIMVLHSDGIRARFSLRDDGLLELAQSGPTTLAEGLLKAYGRTSDDALVVVAMADQPAVEEL